MKLKINKACDLSSIYVLPPQSRRTSAVAGGLESSRICGRSETAASQLRLQQPQQSQLSFSPGFSSQHGVFSQFSQNSQDEILTNERLGTQERENSVKRTSSLPPISYPREENQMMVSRNSSNLMLDNMRQKLVLHDNSLQYMNTGQQDIKSRLDMGLKSLSDQLKLNVDQENFGKIFSMLSSLPAKIDSQLLKSQNDICKDLRKEMQAMACSMKISEKKLPTPPTHGPKAASWCLPLQDLHCPKIAKKQAPKTCSVPKVEMGVWKTIKQERANSKDRIHNKSSQITVSPSDLERERINVTESDEEIDGGFSFLLKEKGTEMDDYSIEEESARILKKARRRKRKHCNTIIIN